MGTVGGEPRWEAAKLGREALAYADTLHNLARYLTGNATDAEDLVRENLYSRAASGLAVHARDQPQSLALPDSSEHVLSLYRRQHHDPTVGGLDTVNPNQHDATESEWLRGDRELDCLRAVVREEIERALMSLSDLSEQEIAHVVGSAVGTVKSRLSRARTALRRQALGLRNDRRSGTNHHVFPRGVVVRAGWNHLAFPGGPLVHESAL